MNMSETLPSLNVQRAIVGAYRDSYQQNHVTAIAAAEKALGPKFKASLHAGIFHKLHLDNAFNRALLAVYPGASAPKKPSAFKSIKRKIGPEGSDRRRVITTFKND